MDYKKEYENAFAIAKDWYNDPKTTEKEKRLLEAQYPELKESEDERIRKEIIADIKEQIDCIPAQDCRDKEDEKTLKQLNKRIAWLEKQGSQNLANSAKTCKDEQQPTNKVEPKFKVGDWLIGNNIVVKPCCITQIHEPYYYLTNENSFIKFGEEDKYHLWTIQDAKGGDVLVDDYGIYIFEKFDECDENCFVCIGAYQFSKKIYECEHMLCSVEVHPATKEQRDLLFQKMREAGYEWDAEKKELTKPEEKSIEKPTKGNYYTCIKDYQFCEHDDITFEMGKIYKCEEDGKITADKVDDFLRCYPVLSANELDKLHILSADDSRQYKNVKLVRRQVMRRDRQRRQREEEERLEQEAWEREQREEEEREAAIQEAYDHRDDLAWLVSRIESLGWKVTLKRKLTD